MIPLAFLILLHLISTLAMVALIVDYVRKYNKRIKLLQTFHCDYVDKIVLYKRILVSVYAELTIVIVAGYSIFFAKVLL